MHRKPVCANTRTHPSAVLALHLASVNNPANCPFVVIPHLRWTRPSSEWSQLKFTASDLSSSDELKQTLVLHSTP
ncbi:hypothetical protein J6590_029354 [Homalodisca vitripennis]|nr:hypothetical protein J6590_029354 [Homalodisca vitripennis]